MFIIFDLLSFQFSKTKIFDLLYKFQLYTNILYYIIELQKKKKKNGKKTNLDSIMG